MLLFGPLATMLAGAGLGAVAGASQKKPLTFDREREGLGADFSPERRKSFLNPALDYLQKVATGQQVGISQGEATRLGAGARGRLGAQDRAQKMNLAEQAIAGGAGPRGGATQAAMAQVGRGTIGAQRGIDQGILNYVLQQRGQDRNRALRAGSMGAGILGRDKALDAQLAAKQFDTENKRHQFGSAWRRGIQGAAAGAGSSMGGFAGGM